jgi:pimeloyl-ACP methyl ester carboxylesterase
MIDYIQPAHMNRRHYLYSILYLISSLFVISCDLNKDDDSQIPATENKYLVNYQEVSSADDILVKAMLQEYEKQIPGSTANFSSLVKHGVRVYKMSYKTTFNNRSILASGLVCIPKGGLTGPYPLLSFQNGTNTLHTKAPSVNYQDPALALIEAVSSFGYIVAIPDYLGFGSSKEMFHPYLDRASTVKSVLDMLRAVNEMVSSKYLNINMNKDLYLMGYSQGGWASMALKQEIETRHPEEFNLRGTACGGGPYNLISFMNHLLGLTTYPMPVFIGYLFNSMINVGNIQVALTSIFNLPYATQIPGLYNGTRDNAYINKELTESISSLFTHDFRTSYKTSATYTTLIAELEKNSIEPWKTTTPLFLRHGEADTYVPSFLSTELHEKLVEKGTAQNMLNFATYPKEDHNSAILPFGADALKWIISLK